MAAFRNSDAYRAMVGTIGTTTLKLTLPSASALRSSVLRIAQAELDAAEHSTRACAMIHVHNVTGSDVGELLTTPPVERAKHFQNVANFLTTLGVGAVPTVAVLDGCVTGTALGVGAHASACVVTERTRLSLPGAAFGFVPESFASYQLARLPPGMGAYLAMTGAALSGQELVELELATHQTESPIVGRIENELGHQRERHLGRFLRNVDMMTIEPRRVEYTEANALFYRDEISECFAEGSVDAILERLRAGRTSWHAQVLGLLELSSPLALALTHEGLTKAAAASCWTEALQMEASLCAAATSSADCTAGAAQLEVAKRTLVREAKQLAAQARSLDGDGDDDGAGRADGSAEDGESGGYVAKSIVEWEHADVGQVNREALASYL